MFLLYSKRFVLRSCKAVSALLISFLCSSCAPQPQTLDELRTLSQTGKYMTEYKEQVIRRPFAAVYRDIEELSEKCLYITEDVKDWTTPSTHRTVYEPKIYQSSDGKGHLTVWARGMYAFGMDMTAMGEKEMKLAVYGATMNFSDLHEGAVRWAKGDTKVCPTLGGPGSTKHNRKTD